MNLPAWLSNALPIFFLLVAIGVVLARLPKVDMGHSEAFKRRRVMNWVPLGLTYAFLYFGRYNLSAIVDKFEHAHLLTKLQFGDIDGVGAITYGVAFLLNGPLTDRFGGRMTILLAAGGSAVMNVVMALAVGHAAEDPERVPRPSCMFANAANMYFQSFGAVSIVKVNAPGSTCASAACSAASSASSSRSGSTSPTTGPSCSPRPMASRRRSGCPPRCWPRAGCMRLRR